MKTSYKRIASKSNSKFLNNGELFLKRGHLVLFIVLIIALICSSCSSQKQTLVDRETIRMGQATWDTGWFQAQVFKIMLEELGYDVREPETVDNIAFYIFCGQGDLDFWTNGWFPIHNRYLNYEGVDEKVKPVGYLVEEGALQGYMIDKTTAEKHEITNLGDFADPEIAKIFDNDNDGKADLIGCNEEWGCETVIEHHLDDFGLRDTVTHVQSDYNELIEETITYYRNGNPILFYTWTPNWTISELKIDEDVIWLNVPHSSHPDNSTIFTETESLPGCLETPCNLGFEISDVRVVANNEFLENNPAAEKLFEVATIPLVDISSQNARMHTGEDSTDDIHRHAEEWIRANRDIVDQWLLEAKEAIR